MLAVIEEVLLRLSNQHLIMVVLVMVVWKVAIHYQEQDSEDEDDALIKFLVGAVFTIIILLIC